MGPWCDDRTLLCTLNGSRLGLSFGVVSFSLKRQSLLLGTGMGLCALRLPAYLLVPLRPGNMSWAHLSCALWIPEVRVGNVEKMEPITNVDVVPVSV